jgi:type IX secretion system PorP/SprF family membrane protein
MKKRLLVLSLITCLTGGSVFAQQNRAMTHFMFDKMSVNPAATGITDNAICGTSIYRNQWDKVNGAPNSVVLNVGGDFTKYIPIKGGISFYHDAIAFTRQNTAVLNVAYPLPLGNGTLQVGAGLGITNMGMNPTWIPPTSNPDPTLPAAFSATKFDANFGLYYYGTDGTGNQFYAGLSSTHLPAGTFEGESQLVPGTMVGFDAARHYYVMGGYTYKNVLPGDDIDGNLMVRTDLVQTSFELSGRYMWQSKAYGGLSYRHSDAIGVMLGAKPFAFMTGSGAPIDFTVGYAYDVTINKLSSVSAGGHEIMLKYCYYLPPIPIQKSKHPRWL